jgi:hypothetical protein
MLRRTELGLLLIAVCGFGWSLVGGESKSPAKSHHPAESALMRAKVASSHKIMEGLVAKDFHEIRTGAEELKQICRGTEWEAHSDSHYAFHRAELVRQANKLIMAADQSNLEAATLGYFNTLTTCINCHDHCRDVLKIANVKRPSKIIPIPTTDSDDVPPGEKSERR